MNKRTALIVGLQAVLIVTLFWMLVFYGKDEYESFRTEQEEEIESLNRVNEKEGVSIVNLSPAVQKNSGIRTALVKPYLYRGEIKSYGHVIAIDSLVDAKARYLTLKADLDTAKSASKHNLMQYYRLKSLNADDKNVSDKAVQEALALAEADKAKITSTELQIKNLQSSMRIQWGEALAKLALAEKLPPHLDNLLNRTHVLVQISLPMTTLDPQAGDVIHITPLNESVAPIQAVYVSPAALADSNGVGKTFYYSAPADLLRIGMRVNVEAEPASSDSSNGVIIPSNAVVWYAGVPWAYFKQGKDQFIRKPISADTEVDEGWFNQGLDESSEVVISGAQLLLSEEFKYQIKNENED